MGRHSGIAEDLHTIAARFARKRRDLPEPQVLVSAPGLHVTSGDRRRRFHSASVGKMLTATLAFQLAESGRLDMTAPLTSLLPRDEIDGLFVGAGAAGAASVTPLQLLTHTSGVADYFEGPNDTSRSFTARVTADRDELFAPRDLIAFSRAHQRPVGAPGERFSYSDTGYVLLARLIEESGGASLGAQLHERILGPAGMDASCLLFHTLPGGGASTASDPGAALDIAPILVDGVDLSRARSLSCDWGGGGLATTLDDLHRFAGAWHGGALIGGGSRARMTRIEHRFRSGIHYGAGVMQLRYPGFFPLLVGLPRTIGHLGVTGVHLFSDPERDITLVLNLHSTREMTRSFQLHIQLLQRVLRARR
ncbi:serine hydrolase domain-containing protein [Microbacterium sp. CFBP9034]|uniref:serine hydrolase domain-containing protein n=1 Tax=Microbacterium sp. CFBP9034 TaxID=3096540 RepID=UPI002A69D894|nr:serine hydrolase domain-containing protein [Microbacterium sp. CFBP9034]MDY0908301.1 serine hydrolase domain-containing protein [Microbacterium sp. CFBP9034]